MDGWTCHNGPHTLTQALNLVRVHVCLAPCHAGSLCGDLSRADKVQRGGETEETAPCNPAQSLLSVRLCWQGSVGVQCSLLRLWVPAVWRLNLGHRSVSSLRQAGKMGSAPTWKLRGGTGQTAPATCAIFTLSPASPKARTAEGTGSLPDYTYLSARRTRRPVQIECSWYKKACKRRGEIRKDL